MRECGEREFEVGLSDPCLVVGLLRGRERSGEGRGVGGEGGEGEVGWGGGKDGTTQVLHFSDIGHQ